MHGARGLADPEFGGLGQGVRHRGGCDLGRALRIVIIAHCARDGAVGAFADRQRSLPWALDFEEAVPFRPGDAWAGQGPAVHESDPAVRDGRIVNQDLADPGFQIRAVHSAGAIDFNGAGGGGIRVGRRLDVGVGRVVAGGLGGGGLLDVRGGGGHEGGRVGVGGGRGGGGLIGRAGEGVSPSAEEAESEDAADREHREDATRTEQPLPPGAGGGRGCGGGHEGHEIFPPFKETKRKRLCRPGPLNVSVAGSRIPLSYALARRLIHKFVAFEGQAYFVHDAVPNSTKSY